MKTVFLSVLLLTIVTIVFTQNQQPCNAATPKWNSAGNNGAGICEKCPNDKPYWNYWAVACVATCPTAAPTYDDNLWCTECAIATPFYDTSIPGCVECPTGYFNVYTYQCETNCPDYAPNYNSTRNKTCVPCGSGTNYWMDNTTAGGWAECVTDCEYPYGDVDANDFCKPCPIAKPYWDPATSKCVDECPIDTPNPGTDSYCVACPVTQPFWDENAGTNGECVACAAPNYYFDNRTHSCVARCADSTPETPGNDTNGWCKNCTVTGFGFLYWDNILPGTCTNICPRLTPTNNSISWCISCADANPLTAITKWDYSTNTCVDTCPAILPDTSTDNWCKECDRNIPLWATDHCEACPGGTPYWDPTATPAPGSCTLTCPALRPYVDSDNWCMPCDSSTPNWDSIISNPAACVTTCPVEAPARDNNNWCYTCSGGTPYWDSVTDSCVATCPNARPVVGAHNWCESCPSQTPKWDPTATPPACVLTCPPAAPLTNNENTCVSCIGGTPIWDPSIPSCVSSCTGAYQVNNGGQCQACPTATPIWDSTTSHCVSSCPASKPYVDANKRCQSCPAGTPRWNPLTSACVATCPVTLPTLNANGWCQACPNATPKWNPAASTCVANCPPTRPVVDANNWCQACPAGNPYWNPTRSVCVPQCLPPMPVVGNYNWCEACPAINPYWDADVPACVPNCPRTSPVVDTNKQCQPCPSSTPNWDSPTIQCVTICPALRPVVGDDNWCEECPVETPYWNGINNICVDTCPPLSPNVGDGDVCKPCTGALLKWDPLTSKCVATCPKDRPFFNKNSVPPACEQGPAVEDIVDYLQTSGVVMPSALAGMQLTMPGLPYVAVTVLLITLLKYVRYFNINFPPKVSKVFQQGSLNVPSLNFGPLFPEDWKLDTYSHPAPYRFAQYDVNGLFVANFWRGISTALIIAFGVGVMQLFIRRKIKNDKVNLVRDKAKNFLMWNYVFSFFVSNISNLVLFLFIEYQSLALHDSMGRGSFATNLLFIPLMIGILYYMIKRIKLAHKIKIEAAKKQEKLPMDESIKVLLQKFKDEHLLQMLFIPIMCIRAGLNAFIISVINHPVVQCAFLVIINVVMLAYYLKYRPHREMVDNIQITAFEITLAVVNFTCLHLATLTPEEQYASEGAGDLIVACNVIMFVLSFVFIFSKVIIAVVRAIREKFRLRRASNSVYVQTEASSTVEMTPTSLKYARLETRAVDDSPDGKEKMRSINFGGSVSIMDIGSEGEQSPAVVSKNLNSNNLKKSFHIVRIPSGEEESLSLSKYVDKKTQ